MNINDKLNEYKGLIDEQLGVYLSGHPGLVGEAMRYSLLSGGKRVRGILCLLTAEMFDGDMEQALIAACAVEMLHCYSLIHDDLPCMDNDDFRRGVPSCHKKFNETIAVLAGDGLLTEAFAVLSQLKDATAAKNCMSVLSHAAGNQGMIHGQELDTLEQTLESDEIRAYLNEVNLLKTGALIEASVLMGYHTTNRHNEEEVHALSNYALQLGVVFQLVDDILDHVSTFEVLGKPIDSDESNHKVTYFTLDGEEKTRKQAKQMTQAAVDSLSQFGEAASDLRQYAYQLCERVQ